MSDRISMFSCYSGSANVLGTGVVGSWGDEKLDVNVRGPLGFHSMLFENVVLLLELDD